MKVARTLIEISEDFIALDQLLEEVEGDISNPAVAEAVEAWFKELDADLYHKLDNYAAYITEVQARAKARKEEADRLANRARINQNTADFLKLRLKQVLEQRGTKKYTTARFDLSVCGNGGKRPVDIHDPNAIPKDMCRHIPESWEPDADKIREHLSAGNKLEGAILQPRGTHLRIK
jgi:hypothetical protein